MDKSILFKIPYGLCLISSDFGGCIVNTAIQITDDLLSVSINKSSYTASIINKSKHCIISILDNSTTMDFIKHFAFKSGFKVDKFDDIDYLVKNGIPYINKNILCNIYCNVKNVIDCDTHYLFILEMREIFNINKDNEMLTYEDYRKNKSSYICTNCHYVYDGKIKFEDLKDDYKCPICGKGKDFFINTSIEYFKNK
jgi:flavin reductase (DIM6/NTAB) family NADH-FMN oxidoreductase RutF